MTPLAGVGDAPDRAGAAQNDARKLTDLGYAIGFAALWIVLALRDFTWKSWLDRLELFPLDGRLSWVTHDARAQDS